MLPTLSRLSVSNRPGSRLHHWCSSGYLRISPLHPEFRFPLRDSSREVSNALPGLSSGISHPTFATAYTRFTPSNSEQRLHPLSYRGCWHRVNRCLLKRYRHHTGYSPVLIRPSPQSFTTLRPSSLTRRRCVRHFAHCARFPTATSRRSLDHVSVPVWLIILSDQLPVFALVGRYPTN